MQSRSAATKGFWRRARLWSRASACGLALVFAASVADADADPAAAPEEGEAASATDLSLVDLMDTEVVSASLSEQSLADAAAVIDVITQDDLRARGCRTVGEALQSIAGVDVISDHYQDNLGVRGVSGGPRGYSRSVKLMIDGQPVSFRSSGENFLGVELIPIGVIDHIEVLRGPASVLYGANAFLGVVNVITRNGYGLRGNSVAGGYEGGSKVASPWGQAIIAQQLGDLSLLLGAVEETRELDGYQLVPLPERTGRRANERSRTLGTPSGSAFGRLTYDSARFGTLSFDASLQRVYRSAEFANWGPLSHDNLLELVNGYARLRYNAELTPRTSVDVAVALSGGNAGRNDRLNYAAGLPTFVKRDLGYAGRDVAGTLTYRLARKSNVVLGADATWDDQTLLNHYTVQPDGTRVLNPPAGTATGERLFRNVGFFGLLNWFPFATGERRLLTGLGLTAGTRVDAHNIYGNNWNGRAGLVYSIKQRHFAKLLFGTSFRAPSATQLFSNFVVPGDYIGNPALKPERAQTLELALGSAPVPGLTLRADGYVTFIQDRVEIRKPPPSAPQANDAPVNSSPIESKGFEAQVDYQSSRVGGYASFSYQRSSYPKRDLLSLNLREVDVLTDAYPDRTFKLGVTWTERALHARANLQLRYTGSRLGNLDNNSLVHTVDYLEQRYALPAYTLVDATLSSVGLEPWHGHETLVLVQVKNLADTRYAFPGSNGFDIPGFERSYALSIQQDL